jgi:uncharacterized SAM-binding protein YcdF (DUF218 family)
MADDELTADQIAAATAYVDIDAPPAGPSAYVLFGTNQAVPAAIAAERFHAGLAPLLIATGGVNRHNGIVEGHEFKRLLMAAGVPRSAIRVESRSANTWQNIEYSVDFIREAVASGLAITAVSKWFHRRAVHCLRTLVPEVEAFHAVGWEPVYAGVPITRSNWPDHPDGRRRVIREWREIPRRVTEGSFREAKLVDGAWR